MAFRSLIAISVLTPALALASGCTFFVEEMTQERTATFTEGGWSSFAIVADSMTGGLNVKGTADSVLKADATVAALMNPSQADNAFTGANLVFQKNGSVLNLSASAGGDFAELLYFQRLRIEAPATVDLDLSVDNTNVVISDMAGNITAKTGSGSAKITTGGSIDLTTSSGTVIASVGFKATVRGGAGSINVTAGSIVDVRSTAGAIVIDTPQGGSVHSDTGTIDLRLDSPNFGATTVDGTSGEVIVRLPKGSQYDLDAFSATGLIDIQVGGLLLSEPYNGPVNGGGPLVKITTTSGSVIVIAE